MSVNPYESSRAPTPLAVQPLELPVRIEHQAAVDDYVEFYLYYQRNFGPFRIVRLLLPALGIVAVLAMLLVAVVQLVTNPHGPDEDNVAAVVAATAVAVVLIPILIALAWFDPPRYIFAPFYRWFLMRGDPAALFGLHVLTITAEHLIEQGPQSEHRFALSSVQKIIVAPQHIFLFLSTLQGIVIPRRALASEQDAQALVALLERLTGAKVIRG